MRKVGMLSAGVLIIAMALLFTGCQKPPEQEMGGSQQAVDAAKQAEAEKYAQSELSTAMGTMDQARAEIETQKAKWFPNYDKAKEMLTQAKTQADQAKEAAIQGKEKAKNAATQAIADAKMSVDAAEAALKSAPKGKGAKADLELYQKDIDGYKTSIADAEKMIASEDFFGAKDKATAAMDGAKQVQDGIAQASQKKK